jgi:hypothetical protein
MNAKRIQYSPPRRPTAQYLENLVWLRAFRDCGWSGKRALAAADAAVATARTKAA